MANNSMSNPLTPLQWLNIKLPQAKQTKKKKIIWIPPRLLSFVARFELEGKCSCILLWAPVPGGALGMRCLPRGVCAGVFVLGCPWPGWPHVGVMKTLSIKLLHPPYRCRGMSEFLSPCSTSPAWVQSKEAELHLFIFPTKEKSVFASP